MTTDSTRIDTLETHLAFQDEAIRQLNNALVAQQGRIDQMQAELERLVATVRDGAHDTRSPPPPTRSPRTTECRALVRSAQRAGEALAVRERRAGRDAGPDADRPE